VSEDGLGRVVYGAITVSAIPGRDLLSLLLQADADITYLCMAGSCGTCRVRILSGGGNLCERSAAEEVMLPPGHSELRLACQADVVGRGDIVCTQNGIAVEH
jgi:ferredoxin